MYTHLKGSCLVSLFCLVILALPISASGKIIVHSFDIAYKMVSFTGEPVQAMSVGGSIPAPTIEARVGDTLRVTFNNRMDVPTSIHWHGVLLPQEQDGVPFLTMMPIQPGTSFTYEYPVIHHGTYWYHSHTGLQEQRGVYGALVFHPQGGERVKSDHDLVVVLSDWTNENPNQVMHNLKKSDDYYALKKNSVQSWVRVFQHGWPAVVNRMDGAWMRMGPMDISDVGYDAFLVNGQQEQQVAEIKPGERVRLRVINAAASSYFFVQYAGGDMTILAADGVDVEPVVVSKQRFAIAETFDLLVTVPEAGAWEFRVTAEDGTGYSSLLLGAGQRHPAPDMPRPNIFMVDHSGHGGHGDHGMMMEGDHGDHQSMQDHSAMGHGDHQSKQDHSEMNHDGHQSKHDHSAMQHGKHQDSDSDGLANQQMQEYERLRALHDTRYGWWDPQTRSVITGMSGLPQMLGKSDIPGVQESPYEQGELPGVQKSAKSQDEMPRMLVPTHDQGVTPIRDVLLELTGDMERYAWSFNNKVLSEDSTILIKKGETVRFILRNTTMMHHPIHLHGHFFRVLNGQGNRSPLKHTVNVPSLQTVTIEFMANEEKDWLFHCHNLYHMKSGMTRVVSYAESTQATQESLRPMFADLQWYRFADLGVQSNFMHGELLAENTRNAFELEYEWDYDDSYEVELVYERYINRFLQIYMGAELEQEVETSKKDKHEIGILGLHYLLPLMIEANLRLDSNGDARLGLSSELQLTDRLAMDWDFNTDDEFRVQMEFEMSKQWVITFGVDDQHDWGMGLEWRH